MAGRLITVGESLGVIRSEGIGTFERLDRAAVSIGGAESNVAIGVARLGGPAVWSGRVGDDALGRRVVRELRAEGVQVRAVVEYGAPTALLLKSQPVTGRTAVTYHRRGSAGSRLSKADVDELVAAVEPTVGDVVHLTGITAAISETARAAALHLASLAADRGAHLSFDVNHRTGLWSVDSARPVYRELAARADLVFAGEDEAETVAGAPGDAEALARTIAELGPSEVVVKRGAEGALALVEGRLLERAAVPIAVVDTVGAGDAFVAGYLAELLVGAVPAVRLDTAVRAGAFACLVPGDWEGAPRRVDLASSGEEDPVTR